MSKLSDCQNLHRCVKSATAGEGGRFICFTRVHDDGGGGGDRLAICATDGVSLWRETIDDFPLFVADHLPPPPPPSTSPSSKASQGGGDALVTAFKSVFLKGIITVSESLNKLHLNISGQELSTIDLELPEAKAADRKKELQAILFHLVDTVTENENSLKSAEKKIEKLEQRTGAVNAGNNVFDMAANVKRKKTNPKVPPKAPGMSIINPSSKRRTAPKGVQFD